MYYNYNCFTFFQVLSYAIMNNLTIWYSNFIKKSHSRYVLADRKCIEALSILTQESWIY